MEEEARRKQENHVEGIDKLGVSASDLVADIRSGSPEKEEGCEGYLSGSRGALPQVSFPVVGELTDKEAAADIFSPVGFRTLHLDSPCVCGIEHTSMRFALIASAPMAPLVEGRLPTRPTVIAISGEEQRHVSKFFRSWRAEQIGWQVIVPLRPDDAPHLFEEPEIVIRLMERILQDTVAVEDSEDALVPFGAEGHNFHLVGTSNGGATALKIAAMRPDLVASLSMVTGFVPDGTDIGPLQMVPSIRMYAGDKDQCGHDQKLTALHQGLRSAGTKSELTIYPGVDHFGIGESIDQTEFLHGLELARVPDTTLSPISSV